MNNNKNNKLKLKLKLNTKWSICLKDENQMGSLSSSSHLLSYSLWILFYLFSKEEILLLRLPLKVHSCSKKILLVDESHSTRLTTFVMSCLLCIKIGYPFAGTNRIRFYGYKSQLAKMNIDWIISVISTFINNDNSTRTPAILG